MKEVQQLIVELAKNKIKELSAWKKVRYEGGRLYYEGNRIINDIKDYAPALQIAYLEYILNAQFIIKDNLPSEAPDITEELKDWIRKKIIKFKLIEASKTTVALEMEDTGELPNKVFISHSSKDIKVVEAFVENILQLGLGMPPDRIFCTSMEGQGVYSGEYIPDRLRSEIKQSSLALLFISDNYRKSEVCLNEVGAAWATLEKKNVIPILLPNTSFNQLGFLDFNRLALRVSVKTDLLQLIDDSKESLQTKVNHVKINKQLDQFLEKLKLLQVNNETETASGINKQPSEWTLCFVDNLVPFDDILRQSIPEKSRGIHEIEDLKVQNNIMTLLAQANFLEELWYKMSDGDGYVEKIRRLPSGNWLISNFNWEVKISAMWVAKEFEHQNDFILIRSEKLEPYKISSDVGGESYTVAILEDGSIVSNNEYSSGYAIINGDTIELANYGAELRNRDPEAHWIFFGSNYHKIGHNPDETIQFCKKLDRGKIEVNVENLKKFVSSLSNHPVVLQWR